MQTKNVLYWFTKPVLLSYTTTMLKMNVQRRAPFPKGARIIAANHPSSSDPFFVAAMLRHQSYILIKDLLFQVPVLGEYLRRSGHIPVEPGKGQQALDTALEYLRAGRTVMIFPEGRLSPLEGGFRKAHSGVARLALESGAPVIPVGIHLSRERLHSVRSTVRGRDEYGHWYLRGPYHITTGSPLYFTGGAQDHAHVHAVADTVMHHIIELTRQSENRMKRQPLSLISEFGT